MSLAEKYRPPTLDQIKGQEHIIPSLKEMAKREHIPHMLFVGPPGSGKTTAAECMAAAIFGEGWRSYFKEINASDERGIDVIRTKVKTLSELVGRRLIFLDEADQLTPDSQWALRRIMERSQDAIFILAANRESKIFDAIKSRCAIYRFHKLSTDIVKDELVKILKAEGMQLTAETDQERQQLKEGFEFLVESADGDLRSAINTLEKLITANKQLTVKEIAFLQRSKVSSEALRVALAGNFERSKELFETSFRNNGGDPIAVCQELYDCILSIPDSDASKPVKIRLYMKLAETEGRIRAGSDAQIQLVGFFASAWLYPHLDLQFKGEAP
jgi:replication factor C small subunit